MRARSSRWWSALIKLGVALAVFGAFAVWRPGDAKQIVTTPRALGLVLAIVAGWMLLSFALRKTIRNGIARALVLAVPALILLWLLARPYFVDKRVVEALPGGAVATTAATVPATTSAPTTAAATTATGAPGSTTAGTGAVASTVAPTTIPATTVPPATAVPTGPIKLRAANLVGIDHGASGEAAIYRLADGSHIVRFENVDIQRGPDYFVYLVPAPGQEGTGGGVNLGALKGNQGSHNYPIPADVDPSKFATVLVWCRAFATPIANATLA